MHPKSARSLVLSPFRPVPGTREHKDRGRVFQNAGTLGAETRVRLEGLGPDKRRRPGLPTLSVLATQGP